MITYSHIDIIHDKICVHPRKRGQVVGTRKYIPYLFKTFGPDWSIKFWMRRALRRNSEYQHFQIIVFKIVRLHKRCSKFPLQAQNTPFFGSFLNKRMLSNDRVKIQVSPPPNQNWPILTLHQEDVHNIIPKI